jgi:hypothetical protein
LGLDVEFVRKILFESGTVTVDRATKDKVYQATREMGYDITKLNISKKMATRKEAISEMIKYIKANPEWGREEILSYMRYCVGLVDRVHKRVLPEAYEDEEEE